LGRCACRAPQLSPISAESQFERKCFAPKGLRQSSDFRTRLKFERLANRKPLGRNDLASIRPTLKFWASSEIPKIPQVFFESTQTQAAERFAPKKFFRISACPAEKRNE
jgi:hypothetical protein